MLPKRKLTEQKKRTKTADEALAALMRLCARSEKCEGDARRLMHRWGLSEKDAEQVLARLVKDRFIDDNRYATLFVREKMQLSGWGVYKIRSALSRKEIKREIIDEALQAIDTTRMGDRLISQLKRKQRTTRATTPYELRNKLFRYGLLLGYEFDTVREAVNSVMTTDEDLCNDF